MLNGMILVLITMTVLSFMGLSGLMFNASICGIRCIGTSIANGEPQADTEAKEED